MVILVPLHDARASSPEPEVRLDDRSKEPGEARDQETLAGQGTGKNARKRKASTLIPAPVHDAGSSPETEVGRDDRSKEPGEAGGQELWTAQDYEKSARKRSTINTLKKLQLREIGFRASFGKEKFKGFKNVILLDMYMYKNRAGLEQFESFMRIRSEIVKMIPVKDMIVLLSRTGVSCIFSRVTNEMIAFVTRPGEMTEDVFYNKLRNSLIVSSSSRNDDHTAKRYRAVPIGLLRTQDNSGYPIFASEQVRRLIDFDAVNGKALIRDVIIFDLNTYSLMYKISEIDVANVLCGPQALLVIREDRKNLLSLVIKLIESGDDVGYIYHPTQAKLDLLEIFHEMILIKERSKGLQMIDWKKTEKKEVPIGVFDYHALYGRNCFLTFQKDSSQLRTLNGTVIKELDNAFWRSGTHEHRICSSSDDDTIIYVAKSKDSKLGSVNVCSIGREVSVTKFYPEVEVTCVSYNEDLNEIYIGTSGGRVYVYSV